VNQERHTRKRVLETLFYQRDRKVRDVDANPFALEFLRGVDRRSTAAKRI
jgi:hypothetical protein